MSNKSYAYFFIIMVSLMTLLAVILASYDCEGQKVLDEDFKALQEGYDALHEEYKVLKGEKDSLKQGYTDLQTEHSKKAEQIEYLEYRIMTDDSISPELKQEIENNVHEEVKE